MTLVQRIRRVFRDLSELWLPRNRQKVVHARVNDYSLLILANEDVGRAIYFDKRFEEAETKYLSKSINSSDTCIDVGANVGYFSMLMAKHAPQGKVYAFEPIPLNACLIRASAELNRYPNISVVEAAVGAADGEATLSQSSDSAYSSMLDTGRKVAERVISTPLVSLDNFLARESLEPIRILKVDVEGAEGLVIKGAVNLLSDPARRPWLVMMEVSDKNLAAFGMQSHELIEMMQAFGYIPHYAKGGSVVPMGDVLSETENVLFLSPESVGRSHSKQDI